MVVGLLLTVLATALPAEPAAALTLPAGFSLTPYATGLSPFDLANFVFLPSGEMLAVGRCGAVRRVSSTTASVAVGSLATVCNGDRGVLGVDLAVDFALSRRLYVLYNYQRVSDGRLYGRLSWFTLDDANAPTSMSGETIVLDDLPSFSSTGATCDDSHTIGTVVAAPDGTLFVGTGDGSSYCVADSSSLAAQDITSPRGKIFHITATGAGVPSNPFYEASAPSSWQSRVHAYGLRNPFRFGLRPGTATLYIGDVGWNSYEEIDVATPGANFGWPCWEGPSTFRNGYSSFPQCQTYYATRTPVAPIHSWFHDTGAAAVGGAFYSGTSYPADYQGAYFFGDYAKSRVWTMRTNAADQIVRAPEAAGFASAAGTPVAFRAGPSGDIYWADLETSVIQRLRYASGNRAPTAAVTASVTAGAAPLAVQFSGAGSTDLDGDTLSYGWSFGDGTTATGAAVTKTYAANGLYTATLTVTDPGGLSGTASVLIGVGQTRPTIDVSFAPAQTTWAVGETVRVNVTATDAEDGILPDASVTYASALQHCSVPTSCHTHPGPIAGEQRVPGGWTVTIPDHGDDTFVTVNVVATDASGLTASQLVTLTPRYRTLTVTSSPAGIPIVVNATDTSTTTSFRVVEGSANSVTAPDRYGDKAFVRWADGVTTRTRSSVTPAADVALTAVYTTVPTVGLTATPPSGVAPLSVTFSSAGTVDPDGDALTFRWSFGDGTADATGPSTTHTYASNGSYTATLTVTDANGASASATASVVVGAQPAGLVAAYGFNEGSGSTTADSSTFANPGTLSNATWTTAGRYGGALSFNGASSMVRTADAPQLRLTNALTMAAWVRLNGAADYQTIVLRQVTNDLSYGLYAETLAVLPSSSLSIGGVARGLYGPSSLPLGVWTHVAFTYDGATARMYVDGVLVASGPLTGSVSTTAGGLRIGGNDVWGEWLNGLVDEVRVYNRALTATEVAIVMNSPLQPVDTAAPTVPGGVTATGGVSTVGVAWAASTDNVGVAGYDVHRSTTAGFTPSAATRVATVPGTAFTDTGLAPGSYRYRVVARDAAGNASVASNEVVGVVTGDVTPPTVGLTAPADGAVVTGVVTVSAAATDDTGVAGVQFLLDGAPLGAEDTSAPYTVPWDTATAAGGPHVLTARARDAAGNVTTSPAVAVTVPADAGPPTSPTGLAATGGTTSVSLAWTAATDDIGVTGYEVHRSTAAGFTPSAATRVATVVATAYVDTALAPGAYVYVVVASDAAGNASAPSAEASAVVTGDVTPPSVTVTAPAAGASVTGTVSLAATASDDLGVVGVQFLVDGQPVGAEDTTSPYTGSWSTTGVSAGNHTVTARARDAAGNAATSNPVVVSVRDVTAPTASVTAPAVGATVTGTVVVTASASDDVGVVGVQFLLDGAVLGAEDTSSPYSASWNTATATAGSHVLTVRARDAAGNTTTSAGVSVTVPPRGPVAAYNFDEGAGAALTDRSGTGNAGTLLNGPVWTTAGRYGGALTFDGVNDRVEVPNSASLNLSRGMTVSAWVRPATVTGNRAVLYKERTANSYAYALSAGSSNRRPTGRLFDTQARTAAGTQLTLNTWSHLAMTYDGTTLRIYVNGTLANSTSAPGPIASSTRALQIGGTTVASEWFSGQIDNLRIYDRALTAAELATDMTTPVA